MSMMPSLGRRASPLMTKRALCSTGSRKVTASSPFFISQSATMAPETWLMVIFSRKLDADFAGRALHYFKISFRIDGR